MAEQYNLPYLAATGNATKVALLRCRRDVYSRENNTDRHAEVSLSDNFVVIAFHALWHVVCTNLAFSE